MRRRLKVPLKRADGSVYGKVGEIKDFPSRTWDGIADSLKKTLDQVADVVSDDETSAHERITALEAQVAEIEKAMGPTPRPDNPPKEEKPRGRNGGKAK